MTTASITMHKLPVQIGTMNTAYLRDMHEAEVLRMAMRELGYGRLLLNEQARHPQAPTSLLRIFSGSTEHTATCRPVVAVERPRSLFIELPSPHGVAAALAPDYRRQVDNLQPFFGVIVVNLDGEDEMAVPWSTLVFGKLEGSRRLGMVDITDHLGAVTDFAARD